MIYRKNHLSYSLILYVDSTLSRNIQADPKQLTFFRKILVPRTTSFSNTLSNAEQPDHIVLFRYTSTIDHSVPVHIKHLKLTHYMLSVLPKDKDARFYNRL